MDEAAFDAVLVSSAWHWFEQPDATNEMARVLRDHGQLFVLWNGFSRDVAWIASLTEMRERPNDEGKRPRGWSAEFSTESPFDVVAHVHVDWEWTRSIDEMVSLFGTYSGAIIRDVEDKRRMNDELRRRLEVVAVNGVLQVPMTVRGTIAVRRARS